MNGRRPARRVAARDGSHNPHLLACKLRFLARSRLVLPSLATFFNNPLARETIDHLVKRPGRGPAQIVKLLRRNNPSH